MTTPRIRGMIPIRRIPQANALVLLCWTALTAFTLLARPTHGWNSAVRLYGVDYSLRIGPHWEPEAQKCKSLEQASADLQQLQILTDRIRIFSLNDCNSGDILLTATQQMANPMGLWLGIWIGSNGTNFVEERQVLLELLESSRDFSNVEGIHVSSEAIYRGELTVEEAIQYRNIIRDDFVANGWSNIPVTVADVLDTLLIANELATVDDTVAHFNHFPFWEPTVTNINTAADYMEQRINSLLPIIGNRQIVIGETGWPDQGTDPDSNPANGPSMQKWLRDFVCLANKNNWAYFWFLAYDSDWQRLELGELDGVEGHFGLFDENGVLKPYFQDVHNFNINCSQPRVDIVSPQDATFAPAPTSPPTTTVPPTSAPFITATADPTMEPSSMPSATVLSTSLPTQHPSAIPTASVTSTTSSPSSVVGRSTSSPSSGPTPAPSATATVSVRSNSPTPSLVKSPAPTTTNTGVEESDDDDDEATSTIAPTTAPISSGNNNATTTDSVSVVTAVQNLKLTLVGIAELDDDAVQIFRSTTREWYRTIYAPSTTRRQRRQLAQVMEHDFLEFDNDVIVKGQQQDGGRTTTLLYDQILFYTLREQPDANSVDALEVILLPFDNETMRLDYYTQLQRSTPALATLVPDAGTAPDDSLVRVVEEKGGTVDDNDANKDDSPPPPSEIEDDEEGNVLLENKLILIAGLCGIAAILSIVVMFVMMRRRRRRDKDKPSRSSQKKKKESQNAAMLEQDYYNDRNTPQPEDDNDLEADLSIFDYSVSQAPEQPLPSSDSFFHQRNEDSLERRNPSLDAYSLDAEQESLSTMDYDYPKVMAGGGNQSVISNAVGTVGESSISGENTRQDSFTAYSPLTLESELVHGSNPSSNPWAKLGPKYVDERRIFTLQAPAGKLGVVVDTPDDGPPIIFSIKESSPLQGSIRRGDRLLAVDGIDVTSLSAVNTSRIISKRANEPTRTFTLFQSVSR